MFVFYFCVRVCVDILFFSILLLNLGVSTSCSLKCCFNLSSVFCIYNIDNYVVMLIICITNIKLNKDVIILMKYVG